MSSARAIFGRAKKVKAAGKKGEYFEAGKYIVGILQVMSKNLEDGLTFIARMVVLKAESNGTVEKNPGPNQGKLIQPAPVNCERNFLQQLDKQPKVAPGNVKAYTLAVAGISEVEGDEVIEAEIDGKKVLLSRLELFGEALCGKDQPARGMILRVSTSYSQVKTGPNAGKWNTYPHFTHVGEETDATEFGGNSDAEVAARRAEWDKTFPLETDDA